jgi:hypothetical protein
MDVTATSLEEKVSKPLKIAMALHAIWNGQGGKTRGDASGAPFR